MYVYLYIKVYKNYVSLALKVSHDIEELSQKILGYASLCQYFKENG